VFNKCAGAVVDRRTVNLRALYAVTAAAAHLSDHERVTHCQAPNNTPIYYFMHLVLSLRCADNALACTKLGPGTKKAHSCVSCFRKEKAGRMKPSE
jgi:hypothetical protein